MGSYHVWTLIVVDYVVCDLIATLQLRVVGSSILVAEDYANGRSDRAKSLSCDGCSLPVERVDSRWVTIGDTSRSFLGAFLLGMGDLIAFAIQHGHSTYHLANVAKLSVALNKFFVQASVVSFASDAFVGMLLSDDRLPVMSEAIESEIQCERWPHRRPLQVCLGDDRSCPCCDQSV